MTKNKNGPEQNSSSFLNWFQTKLDSLSIGVDFKIFFSEQNPSLSSNKKNKSTLKPISKSSPLFSVTQDANLKSNAFEEITAERLASSNLSEFDKNQIISQETSFKNPVNSEFSGTPLNSLKLKNTLNPSSLLSNTGEDFPSIVSNEIKNMGRSTIKNSGTKKSFVGSSKQVDNKEERNKFFGQSFYPGGIKTDTKKQQVVSITYEEIGLFPRSFNRVFDRFFKQLFFDVENLVIQEYRFYRYLFLTTVKCLGILIFVPFFVNFISKNYIVRPITEYYWNSKQPEIFLNSYQQKRAFSELKNFEEKIYFESLIITAPTLSTSSSSHLVTNSETASLKTNNLMADNSNLPSEITPKLEESSPNMANVSFISNRKKFDEAVQKLFQKKTLELANHYNEESIEAITNFFADLISFSTLCFLLVNLEVQINITKSFLLEVFFGLDDSKKSLLILFVTDLLVGYHSPNIWELFFSSLFDHYGLPESQTTIFLLVATLPVLLDVLFKYLIFRHLNRASPATVATYHAMIE